MEWTEQRIETLRRLWGQGQTASQIAVALGGVTRNAVIGKAHRLGLTGRPSPIKRDASGAVVSKRRPAPRRAMVQQSKPMMPLQRALPPQPQS
ncbi:MAG: GcrA family cell cycle regulator, partial [Dongiaceae bacterium]